MKEENNRNHALDLLKFGFAVLILFYHSVYVFQTDTIKFYPRGGYIGVEFFFLVSGFLMAKTAFKSAEKQIGTLRLGQEMFCFFKRKISTIYPYFLFAFTVSVIVQITAYSLERSVWTERLLASVWELLFLHRLVAQFYCWVGGSWYLSAMIIGMLFIFPVLRVYLKNYAVSIAPCIVFLYVSYFSHKYGYLHVTDNPNGLFYDCLVRSVGDLNLGIAAYAVSEKIRDIPFTKLGRTLLSAFALSGYTAVVAGTFFYSFVSIDFLWLFCIAVCVAVTGSEAGSFSRFLNKFRTEPFSFLATFSMALYLNHLVCQHMVNVYFAAWNVEKRVFLFCAMAVGLTFACMFFVKYAGRFYRRMKKNVSKWIFISTGEGANE